MKLIDQTDMREGEAPAELALGVDQGLDQRELRPPGVDQDVAQRELRPPGVDGAVSTSDKLYSDRKHPAHGVFISIANPTIVYVTVCCKNKSPWLASDRHLRLLSEIWQDNSHWVVGRFVLMPDHLHLFAAPQENAVDFDAWVKYWKSQFTKRNNDTKCQWQTDHWDTRVRSQTHYEERSQYMLDNPVRAGLVSDPNSWPYRGIIYEVRWE